MASKHLKFHYSSDEEENDVAVVVETVKVTEEIGGASSERKLFQPLLKEKDQLRFLQGMINFKNDKGKNPLEDKNGFYKSIKDVLEVEPKISLNQCIRQIETFRRKYKKKVSQGKALSSSSSNSHDKRFCELCKEIWTFAVVEKTRMSDRVKIKQERDMINLELDGGGDWFSKSTDLVRLVTAVGVEEDWMKRMWTSVPTKKKRNMEKKWKVLKKKEFELVTNKTGFVDEMVFMMAEASSQSMQY